MSDKLDPPAYVDRWWSVQEKGDDRQGHHHPDEWSVQRRNLDHSVRRGEEAMDPAPPYDEKQKHSGPAKRDSKMHENAEQGCWRTTVERLLAQQCRSDALKQARHR